MFYLIFRVPWSNCCTLNLVYSPPTIVVDMIKRVDLIASFLVGFMAYQQNHTVVEPLIPILDIQCRLRITFVARLPVERWIWTG